MLRRPFFINAFLVDDDEAEIAEGHLLAEDGVGADDDVDLAVGAACLWAVITF